MSIHDPFANLVSLSWSMQLLLVCHAAHWECRTGGSAGLAPLSSFCFSLSSLEIATIGQMSCIAGIVVQMEKTNSSRFSTIVKVSSNLMIYLHFKTIQIMKDDFTKNEIPKPQNQLWPNSLRLLSIVPRRSELRKYWIVVGRSPISGDVWALM